LEWLIDSQSTELFEWGSAVGTLRIAVDCHSFVRDILKKRRAVIVFVCSVKERDMDEGNTPVKWPDID
jgi:hypothetical protein